MSLQTLVKEVSQANNPVLYTTGSMVNLTPLRSMQPQTEKRSPPQVRARLTADDYRAHPLILAGAFSPLKASREEGACRTDWFDMVRSACRPGTVLGVGGRSLPPGTFAEARFQLLRALVCSQIIPNTAFLLAGRPRPTFLLGALALGVVSARKDDGKFNRASGLLSPALVARRYGAGVLLGLVAAAVSCAFGFEDARYVESSARHSVL